MIQLGVSLYPEQETLKDVEAYLAMASAYGFTKVFTSMFSVKGTREEVVGYFKEFTKIAHKYNMKVSGDCNSEFFERMGATERDLSAFKDMGIDIIRMDFSFHDQRDAVLINNKDNIGIEMSTAFIEVIEGAIANGANVENLSTCHNFYPQKYTAPSMEAIRRLNGYWREKGIKTAIFISSAKEGTHGPWPVSDGLPTIEEHRQLPIEVQLTHCLAMGDVDEILIGNAFAGEEEFKAIRRVMDKAFVTIPVNENLGFLKDYVAHGDVRRIPFYVELEEGVTDLEREILFDFPSHSDMGDCMHYMLRSRLPRILYRGRSIPERKCHKTHYTKGDVVIVNDNLAHYLGEIQVVLKDMLVDGQRNLIGRIRKDEIFILDEIKAGDGFTFME